MRWLDFLGLEEIDQKLDLLISKVDELAKCRYISPELENALRESARLAKFTDEKVPDKK